MARHAACSAAILLLAMSAAADHPMPAVQATDRAGAEETSNLLPAHHDGDEEVDQDIKAGRGRGATAGDVASLASADEGGEEVGSDWGEPKKLDGGRDDKSDSDSDSDSDSGSDSDSDSDSDSSSDSDSDSDSDDDNEDQPSTNGSKKHPVPRMDHHLPKMVIKM